MSNSEFRIQRLRRKAIDAEKWDRCVREGASPIIYGNAFYLDHMSPGWEGLVAGNYEAVMPLTSRKKWGIKYLHQPPFVQQTGIFFSSEPSLPVALAILEAVKDHFRFAEIYFNYGVPVPASLSRNNFVLALSKSYPGLNSGYKSDLKNNLKNAEKSQLQYSQPTLNEVLTGFKNEYSSRIGSISEQDFQNFAQLANYVERNGNAVLRSALSRSGELISGALLFRDERRLYLVHSFTPAAGKQVSANHFLIDQIIREFAEHPLTLDFEGSDIEGIAHFFSNFGAVNEPYYFWKHNALPWPLRLLKK